MQEKNIFKCLLQSKNIEVKNKQFFFNECENLLKQKKNKEINSISNTFLILNIFLSMLTSFSIKRSYKYQLLIQIKY